MKLGEGLNGAILAQINDTVVKAAKNKEELWEQPRPPRKVYISGKKVIARMPRKEEA